MLATSLFLAACGGGSIEEQVTSTISEMEASIKEAKIFDVMGFIADDFSGQDGSLDRDRFRGFLLTQMNRHTKIRSQLFPITVTSDGGNFALSLIHI